jgi:FAD/FMN-containing dehydrogenase
MPISETLLAELRNVLGPKGFTQDSDVMTPWLSDWRGRVHGRAAAMLSPATTAEVQAIVRLCAAAGAQLTIQGGNSGQCAGATPDDSGDALLLSLRRMNCIDAIDADARVMRAGAGVILQHAHEAAEAVGLRFPLTLGGKGSATLGGLVSTNAGGTQVLRHGTMRALTAGLEVVLPDGGLLDLMAPLAKDNQGPDPKQMFIGAEGTLGIVTGVTLRLVPAVAARAVAWLAVDSPETALSVLRRLQTGLGNGLEGFELVPDIALSHVLEHIPTARRPIATRSPWHVLIELVGDDAKDDVSAQLEAELADLIDAGLIRDATIAASEAQADAFWAIRDGISEAERTIGPAIQHDISVPVAKMPEYIVETPRVISEQYKGVSALSFGHLGDGNVHFHVRPPAGSDALRWIATHGEAVSRIAYAEAVAMGGSISAEHGIGRVKRKMLAELGDPARISVLRAMKAAMDPAGLINPGVLIP